MSSLSGGARCLLLEVCPPEALLEALSLLDTASLCRAAQTCSAVHTLVCILNARPAWETLSFKPQGSGGEWTALTGAFRTLHHTRALGPPNTGFFFRNQPFPQDLTPLAANLPKDAVLVGAFSPRVASVSREGVARETDLPPFDACELALARLPEVRRFAFHVSEGEMRDGSTTPVGVQQLEHAMEREDVKVIVLFATADMDDVNAFVASLQRRYAGAQIVGGLVQPELHSVAVVAGGKSAVYESGVVGLALGGNVVFNSQVSHASEPLSEVYRVARVWEDRLLGSVTTLAATDWGPAGTEMPIVAVLTRAMSGGVARTHAAVGVADDPDEGFLLHQVVDEVATASGQLAGVVLDSPVVRGQYLRVFGLSAESAIEEVSARLVAAQQACAAMAREPLGRLLFTCGGRGARFYNMRHVECELWRDALPGTPLSGMFALGEVGPEALAGQRPDSARRAPAKLQGFTAVFGIFFLPKFSKPAAHKLAEAMHRPKDALAAHLAGRQQGGAPLAWLGSM